ncbi:MAG: uracil-DNA glycosylase [Alphaproteobacteria bacterium]|nr:uracil-DNA glycosylase [Alphaproteobacteria bacterium]
MFNKETFNLAIKKSEIKECTKCSALCASRTQVVVDKYTKSSALPWEEKTLPIMIIGEAPGETEDQVGMPFMGVSGKVLDRYLDFHELQHYSYVTNIVKCRPEKNRTPTAEEIKNCSHYLVRQIDKLNPSVIITLGKSAVAGLETVGTLSSKYIDFSNASRVYTFGLGSRVYPVIPIYHPSYYLRQKNALGDLEWEQFESNYNNKFLTAKSYIKASNI